MPGETPPTSSSGSPYVFVGGVDVSYACLEALCAAGRIPALAVSYDDSRANAAGYMDFGPLAAEYGFELVRAPDVNDPELVGRIRAADPALMFVIGWSQLVRRELLELPRRGCVGIHPTKLPKGRGRAPIPWTLIKGLGSTASTLFFLTEGVDDGDIVAQVEFPVGPREDAATLYAKHRAAHVRLVTEQFEALVAGSAERRSQDELQATYWERRRPQDGALDWSRPVDELDRLVRAVTRPFPGAFGQVGEATLRIWRAEPGPQMDAPPGTLVALDGVDGVACGDGSLRLLESEPIDDDP